MPPGWFAARRLAGLVWKILVFVAGLFAATGVAMWLKRRRPAAIVIPLMEQSQTARRAGE
jgi:hypothetical protein